MERKIRETSVPHALSQWLKSAGNTAADFRKLCACWHIHSKRWHQGKARDSQMKKMCCHQDERTCMFLFAISSREPEKFFWCHNDTSLGHYFCRITIPARFSGLCSRQWWNSLITLDVNAFLQNSMNYRLSIVTAPMNTQCISSMMIVGEKHCTGH